MIRVFLTLTDPEANAPERAQATPAPERASDDESLPWLGKLGLPGLGLVQKAYAEGAEWLGRALDLGVIAEGVETAAQLEILQELGCGFGQGYLYSRPVAAPLFPAVAATINGMQPA